MQNISDTLIQAIYKPLYQNRIGKISFLPKAQIRPTNPSDLNLKPEQEKLVTNIIVDGYVLKENLKYTKNDEIWLKKELDSQGFNDLFEIILATCDSNNKLTVYSKKDFNNKYDIF